MAWRRIGAKPLSKAMLGYCQLDLIKLQWNFKQNTKLLIHENASQNIVCEIAAILSRGDELRHSLGGKLWYLQHNHIGDTIVYH